MAFSTRFIALTLALTILTLLGIAPATAQPAEELEQQWVGRFEMNGASLTFNVGLTPDENGELAGVISIPFQNVENLALGEAVFASRQVRLVVPPPTDAVFEGRLSPDGKVVKGTMTQGENEFPFTLERVVALGDTGEVLRPQTPTGDFPYTTRGLTIQIDDAGVALGGTLTLPDAEEFGEGPYACAVLLTGSGPQDRDESMFGHKPFAVLADALARAGVATLRCDDRGVGSVAGAVEHLDGHDGDRLRDAVGRTAGDAGDMGAVS